MALVECKEIRVRAWSRELSLPELYTRGLEQKILILSSGDDTVEAMIGQSRTSQ